MQGAEPCLTSIAKLEKRDGVAGDTSASLKLSIWQNGSLVTHTLVGEWLQPLA
jgi:hypothetical protein